MPLMKNQTPIRKASDLLGGVTALGIALNISGANISIWIKGNRPVPAKHCVKIEKLTQKQVTRQDLRPNDYWLIWPDLEPPKS